MCARTAPALLLVHATKAQRSNSESPHSLHAVHALQLLHGNHSLTSTRSGRRPCGGRAQCCACWPHRCFRSSALTTPYFASYSCPTLGSSQHTAGGGLVGAVQQALVYAAHRSPRTAKSTTCPNFVMCALCNTLQYSPRAALVIVYISFSDHRPLTSLVSQS